MDELLKAHEAAALLHTSERFVRRLIAERRIEFVKIGRHVRIRESVLTAFVVAGTVEPLTTHDVTGKAA
ncbi:helix-turn-helix domain-containing protein [Streptosporangium canum]|uniref:helix-turn-helix domain-containing protein n=1 Tax=Streptosporangium canum TaxID=324952 RepID=UPI003448C3A4